MSRLPFFVSAFLYASGQAHAALEPVTPWHSWFEGGIYGSSVHGRGEGTFFIPLGQTESDLVFLDFRNRYFSNDEIEGNYAIGYRQMQDNLWNLGGFASIDARRSENKNKFYQLTSGVEALHPNYDFRFNYYQPLNGPIATASTAEIVLDGSSVFMIGGEEVPLAGYDYEFGYKLPVDDWLSGFADESELRIYAGAFHFEDNTAINKVAGLRGRIQWKHKDVLPDIPGSELSFNYMQSRDDIRHGVKEFGINLKIPFGDLAPTKPLRWSKQRQRMAEGLVRDIDIVTTKSGRESITDNYTGATLNQVVYADGAAELTTALAADTNTLVVVSSSAGNITGNFTLQEAQTLLGAGGTLALRGTKSNVVANVTVSGSTPTIAQTAGTIFTAANRTHIADFTISGGGNTFSNNNLLSLSANTTNVVLSGSTVSNIAGYIFDINGSNSIGIYDSNFSTSYKLVQADSAEGSNTVVAKNLTINDLKAIFDLNASDNNNVDISSIDVDIWHDDFIEMGDSNLLTMSGITTKWSAGAVDSFSIIDIGSSNTISVSNSNFSNFGSNLLQGSASNNTVTLNDVTVDGADAGGALVNWGSGDSNVITVNNLIASNAPFGIFLLNDNNTVTVSSGSITNTSGDIFDVGANTTITVSNLTASTMNDFISSNSDNGAKITISDSTFTDVGNYFIDGANSDEHTITMNNVSVTATAGASTSGIDVRYDNVLTLTDVTLRDFGGETIDLTDRNTLTLTNSTIDYSSNGNSAMDLGDENTVTISGSTITGAVSAGGSGFDISDDNILIISNTDFSDIGNDLFNNGSRSGNNITVTGSSATNVEQIVFDMGSGSTLSISDFTLTGAGDSLVRAKDNVTLSIANTTLNGSMGSAAFEFTDAGTAVTNSTGNINNLDAGHTLCDASAGSFTGSISFTDGTTLVDGDANCN